MGLGRTGAATAEESAAVARTSDVETLAGHAEAIIQRDIISGALAPGARLRVQELSLRYGVGATPIREALSRLSAIGHVHAIENRGFRVASLSREDLADLVAVRQALEPEALRRAMANGGADWEAGIVAALHKLERLTRAIAAEQKGRARSEVAAGNPAWELTLDAEHRGFHRALIAACRSPRLMRLHDIHYDQTFRYRAVMFKRLPDFEAFLAEHAELARLAIDRRAEAIALLTRHLHRTVEDTYPDGPADTAEGTRP